MTKYREILRLKSMGFSERNIVQSCSVSRNTVAKATAKASEMDNFLIRKAGFEQSDACIADIDYTSGRKLNRELIERLATCEFIGDCRNIFITGATGSGKTYMACAFGMEACK